MKNKQEIFHIRWILVGLLYGFYDIYLKRVRNIYPRNMYTGLWVFRLSPKNYECTYVQHLAEYLITYFSEDTGIPVYWICHMDLIKYIRTYDFKLFQVEVTSVTSV